LKGGKRPGAGRKPSPDNLKRERVTIRLPKWLIEWLKKHKDQGKTVEEALIEKYKIERPKKP